MIKHISLYRADCTDFKVIPTKLALRVENRMYVQPGCCRPSRNLSESKDKLLLEVIREIMLGSKECHAAL